MLKTNNFLFICLYVIAWIIFVGLSIEAGGLIVNFFFSLYNPAVLDNLYQKLDLTPVYEKNQWAFFSMYSFLLFISVLKAVMFYTVINLMHKLDLKKPFNPYVAKKISSISYYTLAIGLLSAVARQSTKTLMHHGYEVDQLNQFWGDGEAFIIMGAVIYIIATIFKKGIEIQNENDLTV